MRAKRLIEHIKHYCEETVKYNDALDEEERGFYSNEYDDGEYSVASTILKMIRDAEANDNGNV